MTEERTSPKYRLETLLGKKFLLASAALILATVLLSFAKISSAEWVTIVKFDLAIYLGGNLGNKIINGDISKLLKK